MASRAPIAEIFHTIRHLSKHVSIAQQLQNPITSRALAATATLASTFGSIVAYANMNRHQRDLEKRLGKLREDIAVRQSMNQSATDMEHEDFLMYRPVGRKMQTAYFMGTFFICSSAFFAFYLVGRWRGGRMALARWKTMQIQRENTWARRDGKVQRSLERLGRVKKDDI